jgi:hypothetical protein
LLQNAWKSTVGQGDAERHQSIEFGITPDADARIRCYVRDNGAGFDPAYRETPSADRDAALVIGWTTQPAPATWRCHASFAMSA